jgi:hypothetical protein
MSDSVADHLLKTTNLLFFPHECLPCTMRGSGPTAR